MIISLYLFCAITLFNSTFSMEPIIQSQGQAALDENNVGVQRLMKGTVYEA